MAQHQSTNVALAPVQSDPVGRSARPRDKASLLRRSPPVQRLPRGCLLAHINSSWTIWGRFGTEILKGFWGALTSWKHCRASARQSRRLSAISCWGIWKTTLEYHLVRTLRAASQNLGRLCHHSARHGGTEPFFPSLIRCRGIWHRRCHTIYFFPPPGKEKRCWG